MAEESARVSQRCQEAKATRQLMLDGCDLRKFPDAIFFFVKDVDLQTTSLANNQLKKIPAKLGLKFTTITCEYILFYSGLFINGHITVKPTLQYFHPVLYFK